MKRLVFALLMLLSLPMMAMAEDNNNVQLINIPQDMKISDKIFIVNKSPYLILQVMVAQPKADGGYEPLGNGTFIRPGEKRELASFDHNWLKNLRGKTIAVKVKGAKAYAGDDKDAIDPKNVTYSFDIQFHEDDHDLYLETFFKGNDKDVMNF